MSPISNTGSFTETVDEFIVVVVPFTVKLPVTVIDDAVNPLLNVGVAFTVNVLAELEPSTVLLVAVSNPDNVDWLLTNKLPLDTVAPFNTVKPEPATTVPDNVDVPVITRLFEVNPLLNVGVAFTVNVFAELEPSVVLLDTFNAPLIVVPDPIVTGPLTVSCDVVKPDEATTVPDNVDVPVTRRLFDVNPLLNVGVAFIVNVFPEFVPSTVLLTDVNNPLIVALVPIIDPLTLSCEVVNPLLNVGVAFTVNVLAELEPSTVLLVAVSNPDNVDWLLTNKPPLDTVAPFNIVTPFVTLTVPDKVDEPLTKRLDDVNPLLNVGEAFTVNVFAELEPSVVLLNTFNAPLIDVPDPIVTGPLTVSCDVVKPDEATTVPDKVDDPVITRLFDVNPLLNVGVALTVNVLFELEPSIVLLDTESNPLIDALVPIIDPLTVSCEVVNPLLNTGVAFTVNVLLDEVPSTALLTAVNSPLIVSFDPISTDPLTVSCEAIKPFVATTVPDKVDDPVITRLEDVNPLLNVGVAFTVNVLFELDPSVVLLVTESNPLIVVPDPIVTGPLTVSCDVVKPDEATTAPDNVDVPVIIRLFDVNPLLNVGVAFTVNVFPEFDPRTVLLAVNNPFTVSFKLTIDPLTVRFEKVKLFETLSEPALIVPVVVILFEPVLIDPKPLVMEPLLNAPTVVRLDIVVTEFCVAVLIVPSILAFIVPTAPLNILPRTSLASGIKVNFLSVSSIPKKPTLAPPLL